MKFSGFCQLLDRSKRGQLIGGGGAGAGEKVHDLFHSGEPQERGLHLARPRKEFDGCGGDDAEGALAADEELLQIVAGVVLAQPPQPVPDTPVGQYDLEAQVSSRVLP